MGMWFTNDKAFVETEKVNRRGAILTSELQGTVDGRRSRWKKKIQHRR